MIKPTNVRHNKSINICYLKDQPKSDTSKDEKMSFAFLSSLIQNDRFSSQAHSAGAHADTHPIGMQADQPNLDTHPASIDPTIAIDAESKSPSPIRNFKAPPRHNKSITQIDNKTQEPKISTLKRWQQIKTKSCHADERLLNNLIGLGWDRCEKGNREKVSNSLRQTIKNQQKAFQQTGIGILKKSACGMEESEVKAKNKQMFKQHFETFLQNKKSPSPALKTGSDSFYIGKLDDRFVKSSLLYPPQSSSFLAHSRGKAQQACRPIAHQGGTTATHRIVFTPATIRSGFEQIPNFEWSKLNKTAKYKL